MDNRDSGNQYYFNSNSAATNQSNRTYSSSGYSNYPTSLPSSYSPNQQIRMDNSYQLPQQYQSVGGFNRNTTQQRYQSPQSPAPQVRASVRVVGSQEQYPLPTSSQRTQSSPQQQHFQFDARQQPGHPSGPAVVYQTPGAAQFTHRNVDLWTEGSSQGQDHHVQAQRVPVRSVPTGSPQQSHSVSPQRPQDHLQQYYNQLTPEQHQQLLRQQQLQRQQEQNSFYEQQRVSAQQISPSTQHRSTAGFPQGQQNQHVSPNQQGRGRSDSERQRQDEQDFYAAQQRQIAAQRSQVPVEQSSHPVGIRNLMTKFVGQDPAQSFHPRSRSTTSRHYSSSSYTNSSGPTQNINHALTSNSMTYSALPKALEPPVNSVEYYQMQLQQQGGNPFTNIQQTAAPAHIQHTPMNLGGLRDRFKTGSFSDDYNRPQVVNHHQPPPPQQQQQQASAGGSNLSSLRNQFVNRAKESSQDELPAQPTQTISRTIMGEDTVEQKPASQAPPQQQQQQQQQPPAPVLQAPEKGQAATENETPNEQVSSTADEGVSSF